MLSSSLLCPLWSERGLLVCTLELWECKDKLDRGISKDTNACKSRIPFHSAYRISSDMLHSGKRDWVGDGTPDRSKASCILEDLPGFLCHK